MFANRLTKKPHYDIQVEARVTDCFEKYNKTLCFAQCKTRYDKNNWKLTTKLIKT